MSDTPPTAATSEPPIAQAPVSPLELFLEKNFKKIVIALGLVVLLLFVFGISRHFSHEAEMEAAEAFTSAKTIEDCDVIVQKYAGTKAAGNSLLLKASLLWDAGKKESSVAALQDFIKNHSDHPLLPNAQVSLGSKQASLGEKDAARKTLEAVVRDYPKNEAGAAAQTQLGDMLWEEGKVEEAKKLFSELPRNYPGSPFIAEVDQRTKVMGAGLPTKEVDPPPAPPKLLEAPKSFVQPLPGLPSRSSTAPTIDAPLLTPIPGVPMPSAAPPAAPAPAPAPKAEEKPPAAPATAPSPPAAPAPAPAPAPATTPAPKPADAAPAAPAPAPVPPKP